MKTKIATLFVPISWGELIDKLTILKITDLKIDSVNAKKNIRKEFDYLSEIVNLNKLPEALHDLKNELRKMNLKLWEVEDKIREK